MPSKPSPRDARRKRPPRALLPSDVHARRMIGSVRDYAILSLDTFGRVTSWNPGAETLFGYTAAEMLGQPTDILFTPEDRGSGAPEQEITNARERGHAADERWNVRKDGSRFFASEILTPIRDEGGALLGFTKVARDVTERKRAFEAREHFFDVGADLLVIAGFEGRFRWVSPTWERAFGWTFEEMTTYPWTFFVHPDDQVRSIAEAEKITAGQETLRFENRYRTKDGSWRWLSWKAKPDLVEQVMYGGAIDITAHKNAAHFRAVFESAPGAYLVVEPEDFRVVAVSDALLRMTMRQREDVMGGRLLDLFPDRPDDEGATGSRNLRASLERVKAKRQADALALQRYPFQRPEAHGAGWEERWWSILNLPVLGPAGELAYIIHRTEDVTSFVQAKQREGKEEEARQMLESRAEHMEAEIVLRSQELQRANEQLSESEDRFRTLAENIAQLAWMADENGWIFWYNQRWFDFTGTTLEEMQGWGWQKVHHPDYVEPVTRKWQEHLRVAEPWEDTFPLKGKDGQHRWFLSRARPIRDRHGNVLRWIGTNTDVTEQREAAIQRERFFEVGAEMLVIAGFDGYFKWVSPVWERTLGWPAQELMADPWIYFVHPDDIAATRAEGEKLFHGEDTVRFENRYRCKDGSYRWIAWKVKTFPNEQLLYGGASDITARKLVEEEREALLRTLRATDRRKDEFLAMLAHELRNPLAAIRSAMQVCRDDGEREVCDWALDVIDRQGSQLARLVDDLLDVSRITSGKIRLRKEPIDAAHVLDRAVEVTRPLVVERGHELILDYDRSGARLPIEADPTRIEQVVVNLLTNAAKYTDNGGRIWLTARRERAARGPSAPEDVVISVRDTGIGIPPEKLSEMFELFAQGERGLSRSEGGLGIGLTIVQRLVEMHGGTVTAHDTGDGSEFIVRLPTAVTAAAEPASAPPKLPAAERTGQSGKRVLVVDDNVDAAQGLARLLKIRGHIIELAYDGETAVEKARAFAPASILLDIGLPGLSGYEVASQLRTEPCCRDATIIAISGYGQEEDRRRSKESGIDHHLVKPVDFDEIKRLLAEADRERH